MYRAGGGKSNYRRAARDAPVCPCLRTWFCYTTLPLRSSHEKQPHLPAMLSWQLPAVEHEESLGAIARAGVRLPLSLPGMYAPVLPDQTLDALCPGRGGP